MNKPMKKPAEDFNQDPITGAPGAHPVGTGAGAAAGGIAGAAAGTMIGGPIGTAVGATVGAIAGGLAGKAAGEAVNPTLEDAYWRDQYNKEPYYTSPYGYDDYAAAYRTGYEAHTRYPGKSFEEIESDLQRDYTSNRGRSRLDWNDVRPASYAAWNRLNRN